MIKYSNKQPKLWWFFKLFFPQLDWNHNIFTWGDTIYSKEELRPDVEVHELEHIKQQRGSKFYGTFQILIYLLSRKYRYKLELEAVKAQLAYAKPLLEYSLYTQLKEEQIHHLTQIIGQGKIYRSQVIIDLNGDTETKEIS